MIWIALAFVTLAAWSLVDPRADDDAFWCFTLTALLCAVMV